MSWRHDRTRPPFCHRIEISLCYEVVGEAEFVLERLVVARAVETDTKDHRVLVVECLDSITEPVAFNRSPGGISFRIPPERHVLPRMVVQRHRCAVLVRQGESRRLLSNFYQGHVRPSPFHEWKSNHRETIARFFACEKARCAFAGETL